MPDFYSVQDVLSFAIRLEQISQEFYRNLSKKTHSPSVSRYLEALVKEEQLHEQRLKQLLDEQGIAADLAVSTHEVDCYIQAMDVPGELDYKQAVKLAMDKEKAARMLYSVIAGVMDELELKTLFQTLSEQEQNHMKFFEKEYRHICITQN
jgi:rubrerythrin